MGSSVGKVMVFRDDGRSWPSEPTAEDELWLKPGAIQKACEGGYRLLGHRYWLYRSRGEGRDDVRVDFNSAMSMVAAALEDVEGGKSADAAFKSFKRNFTEASKRVFD